MFTPIQKLAARVYGGGDYAHLTRLEDCEDCGDTLFAALQRELDPGEDCDGIKEARIRVRAMIRELQAVSDALELAE
jgi:hypothetical protein